MREYHQLYLRNSIMCIALHNFTIALKCSYVKLKCYVDAAFGGWLMNAACLGFSMTWQAQVSKGCIGECISPQKRGGSNGKHHDHANATNLRNIFNERVSMFAKIITHYSEETNRYWWQVAYPEGNRREFTCHDEAKKEEEYYNQAACANLKIGGYSDV